MKSKHGIQKSEVYLEWDLWKVGLITKSVEGERECDFVMG